MFFNIIQKLCQSILKIKHNLTRKSKLVIGGQGVGWVEENYLFLR